MVGAIAGGDRHTHAMSSGAAGCGHLRLGNQQTFVTSPGDGEVTSFGLSFSSLEAGHLQASCCDEDRSGGLGERVIKQTPVARHSLFLRGAARQLGQTAFEDVA